MNGKARKLQSQELVLPELAIWNAYFLIKLMLYFQGKMQFHVVENIAFAIFLLLPVSLPALRVARQISAVIFALWLIHLDSNLPPLERLFAQLEQLSHFESDYLVELAWRFVPDFNPLIAVVGIAVYIIANRYFRLTSFVLLALFAASLHSWSPQPTAPIASLPVDGHSEHEAQASGSPQGDEALNNYLSSFFSREARRQVRFPPLAQERQAFDVIFLSVCSLSWDDLDVVEQRQHPLLQRFDFVFEQFNSATSYSGPAVLRLSRASCGQLPHSGLYEETSDQCLLMTQFTQQGYDHALLMNHDGHFDNFLESTRQLGHVDAELFPLAGIPQAQKAFDGSPIYSDLAVLENWWQQRLQSPSPSTVALYNTTSLHDGNRLLDSRENLRGAQSYKRRMDRLFGDISRFLDRLQQSGRNVVVVLVPEHGAGLRGDAMQIPGMREIPTPAITQVPVAIKLIGPNLERQGAAARITQPSSYQAIGQLLADFMAADIFASKQFKTSDWLSTLPRTEPVSQNDGSTMLSIDGASYLSLDGSSWTRY
jgi:cellulose synthase operon protein YhjU